MNIHQIILIIISLISITYAYDCYTIVSCSPEISAFDHNNLNQTIEIRCTFRNRIENPLDVMWKFYLNNEQRMAIDMEGVAMAPFKHSIIHVDENPEHPYSISVLKVPLLNASYFTNYTCVSLIGSCYRTVKINLKQKALGYMNSSPVLKSIGSVNLVLVLITSFISFWTMWCAQTWIRCEWYTLDNAFLFSTIDRLIGSSERARNLKKKSFCFYSAVQIKWCKRVFSRLCCVL